jgi:hypothetical protein
MRIAPFSPSQAFKCSTWGADGRAFRGHHAVEGRSGYTVKIVALSMEPVTALNGT